MKRILVTGNAGAGKSTLARRIAAQFAIPFHSLDRVVWQTGWKKTLPAEKTRRIQELTEASAWVIDGVSPEVQSAADVIVFLDVPRRVCFWRVMRRNWKYLFRSRPELPPGCPEVMIIPTLCRIIWNFPARIRPHILAQAYEARGSQRFFHIKTNADLEECLAGIDETSKRRRGQAAMSSKQPIIPLAIRNIVILILAVFAVAGCNRKVSFTWNSSSRSEWNVNGKRTITRTENGVSRKLETTPDVEIENGHVTKFPKGALVKLQESGGPQQRQAELRESGDSLELWIKDKEAFRRGSPEEEAWLEGFLRDVVEK